jgi:hypothetical protein
MEIRILDVTDVWNEVISSPFFPKMRKEATRIFRILIGDLRGKMHIHRLN